MKNIILISIMMITLMGYSQQYDTLRMRGEKNYILVPVDGKNFTESRSAEQPGGSINNIYTDIIASILAVLLSGYLISIKRGQKSSEKRISEGQKVIEDKVDNLVVRVNKMDETLKEQTIIVTEISLCNNVMSRIDYKIQLSLGTLEKNDTITKSFVVSMANGAKDMIQWAIHTKLDVSEDEIRARFQLINNDVRNFLKEMPKEFQDAVRPELKRIFEHHVDRVCVIARDKVFNSHLNDFFTLTEQTVNEAVRTIVTKRLATLNKS